MERRGRALECREERNRASRALQEHLDAHRAELLRSLAVAAEEGEQAVPMPGLLTMPCDGTPAIVYVTAYFPILGCPIAVGGFGLSKLGPFYSDGIKWSFQRAEQLHVIWSLTESVSYLTSTSPGISFSLPFEGSQLSVVPAKAGTYSFTAHFTKGGSEEPRIVVASM
ncbi:MAG: hypothetical protein R3B48_15185 [Kofleriaceae bacterium]